MSDSTGVASKIHDYSLLCLKFKSCLVNTCTPLPKICPLPNGLTDTAYVKRAGHTLSTNLVNSQ